MSNPAYCLFTILFVFAVTIVLTHILIPRLIRLRVGQTILEIGPIWHKNKEGTPTMGGLAPLFAVFSVTLIFSLTALSNHPRDTLIPFWLLLLYAVLNAVVGIIDDMTKLKKKQNQGLTPIQKLILQFTFALAFLLLARLYGVIPDMLRIPYVHIEVPFRPYLYLPFSIGMVAIVNFANLTDGIDGLAASTAAAIGSYYSLCAVLLSSVSLSLGGGAMLGAALGFLLFNYHPARLFMGDTGSLFFGGLAVGGAFLLSSPLLILPIAIVYLLEGASVILQVVFFKLSGGRRLFRMAPFHHHLEKGGWKEGEIVILFFVLTLIGCAVSYFGLETF